MNSAAFECGFVWPGMTTDRRCAVIKYRKNVKYDVSESRGDLIGNLKVRYAIFAYPEERKLRQNLVNKEL